MWVFGYGSLVHRGSLAKGLGRAVVDGDLVPATLRGYRRVWGAGGLVACEGRPGVTHARFLDLEPDVAACVNGALVRVTPAEFEGLLVREKGYAVYDVTRLVDAPGPDARCVAFASGAGTVHAGEVVLGEYVRLVEEAFAALAPGELERFRALTDAPGVPVVPGRYRFVDPAQNARTSRADVVVDAAKTA
jgi:hypothetical protein